MKLRIGTRGSKLALWQANNLGVKLESKGVDSELVVIKTKGDKIQHLSFDKIEGKGFFTREIEEALIAGEVDVAVHSLKDLPTSMQEDLVIGGLSERADPADLLIIHKESVDLLRTLKIKKNSIVGTSSIRRKVQLHKFDQDIQIMNIRGNVPTRIQKVANSHVDAVVLAASGVERLGIDLGEFEVLRFNPIEFIPAPGQGVNAYQCRRSDKGTRRILSKIHQRAVSACTNIERTILKKLDGGCQLPLGAYCKRDKAGFFHCYTILDSLPGQPLREVRYSSSTSSGIADHIVSQLLSP